MNIIEENKRRLAGFNAAYDPVTGIGSPIDRERISYFSKGVHYDYWAPKEMIKQPLLWSLKKEGSVEAVLKKYYQYTPTLQDAIEIELIKERYKHDFEFWAYTCVKIQDKITKKIVPFRLNRAQRRLVARLERMRLKGVPIRIIVLKARQWGGSTLVQIYMAWIQIIHKKNWHSVIIADVKDQARNIRGMYNRMADYYPSIFGKIELLPYQNSSSIKVIKDRDCIIGVGSVQEPEAMRSFDFAMAHLSEVGSWQSTGHVSAEALAQNIRAMVPSTPYSIIVMESTAKGVGNFFHREWQAAVSGESGYEPLFVAWWEIEMYQRKIHDYDKFISNMNEYDHFLWNLGATLESINWYNWFKKHEHYEDWRMHEEFPSTDTEAFQSSGHRAFHPLYVIKARKTCLPPEFTGRLVSKARKGPEALVGIRFEELEGAELRVWLKPDKDSNVANRYALFADIGGRTEKSCRSSIVVLDRYWMIDGGPCEVAASWSGHLDQDLFAWEAVKLASWYNNGLLGVETNSLDHEQEGDHFLTVLDEIAPYYTNLYARTTPEKIRQGYPTMWGWLTDRRTKPLMIDALNAALRDESYIERELEACDEMDTYEFKDSKYQAREGNYADRVITRAGALVLALNYMPMPKIVEPYKPSVPGIMTESTF